MRGSNQQGIKILAVILLLVVVPIWGCGSPALPTLVPTANANLQSAATASSNTPTPTVVSANIVNAESLRAQMVDELRNYDYEQQQILVTDVEIRGEELVVYIQRQGSPLLTDYFGQLGLIHGVIAANEPDITTVRTIDVDAGNGFVIDMGILWTFIKIASISKPIVPAGAFLNRNVTPGLAGLDMI